jgi:gluconate 2-dehydrogenase gamma chain
MQRFFGMVVRHAMQGYYSHPKYGGNKDGASWKMLKYVGARHL